MSLEITHVFLVEGQDCDTCKRLVERFLARTQLVKYDVIHILHERCRSGRTLGFLEAAEAGAAANRGFVRDLAAELTATGHQRVEDFLNESEGYPSKILHIIAHVLDGFFGIDSIFYNLVEDSHWLSTPLKERIRATPEAFWLIEVEGRAASPAAASVIHSETEKTE